MFYGKLNEEGQLIEAFNAEDVDEYDVEVPEEIFNIFMNGIMVHCKDGEWIVDEPEEDLDVIKGMKFSEILSEFESRMKAISFKYPPSERETFTQQVAEATEYMNTQKAGPLISELAIQRQVPLEVLSKKILDKNTEASKQKAEYITKFRTLKASLEKASSKEEIESIRW